MRELLTELARAQGEFLNFSEIARRLGVTSPTVKAHIAAFQGLFLVREHGKAFFFEDQGTASHLLRFERSSPLKKMQRILFAELQQQQHYRFRSDLLVTSGSARKGNSMPFVLRHVDHGTMGLLVDDGDMASDSSVKICRWFLKKHPQARCVVLHQGNSPRRVDRNLLSVPFKWFF